MALIRMLRGILAALSQYCTAHAAEHHLPTDHQLQRFTSEAFVETQGYQD